MSTTSTESESNAGSEPPIRLLYMFHPSVHVLDLGQTERWYERVFGLPSTRLSAHPVDLKNRMDYATFTFIRDVLIDSIDPKLFVKNGEQKYATVDEPRLKALGWYVDGLVELYAKLRSRGVKIVGVLGEEGTDDQLPTAPGSAVTTMYFTVPDDVGLRYQFIAPMPMTMDPRMTEGWELGDPDPEDPLGIEFTSHHTILTDQPERALQLLVDVLGGTVIHTGRNDVLGAMSTYVALADGVYEFATPDPGTPAHADWEHEAPRDTYHAITFKVTDVAKARRHLVAQGIDFRTDTESHLVTDPKSSMGIPWGFTTLTVPGDER